MESREAEKRFKWIVTGATCVAGILTLSSTHDFTFFG